MTHAHSIASHSKDKKFIRMEISNKLANIKFLTPELSKESARHTVIKNGSRVQSVPEPVIFCVGSGSGSKNMLQKYHTHKKLSTLKLKIKFLFKGSSPPPSYWDPDPDAKGSGRKCSDPRYTGRDN